MEPRATDARRDAPIEPDHVIEAYKKDVDRSLIREQLRRSIHERVQIMVAALRFAERLHDAGRPSRP